MPPPTPGISPKENYADQAERVLRSAIVSGLLEPGARYSVDGIRTRLQLDVSRTPVREALVRLSEAGMVSFESNQGVRVLAQDPEDLQELFEIRIWLEVPAAYHAAAGIDQATRGRLRHELDEMHRLAQVGDKIRLGVNPTDREFQDLVIEFLVHDKEFHQIILSAGGNQRLAALIGNYRDVVTTQGASTLGQTRTLAETANEHEPILAALASGNRINAARTMYEHLAHTGDDLVTRLGRDKQPAPRRRLGSPWFETMFGSTSETS